METINRSNLRELQADEKRRLGLQSGIKVVGSPRAGDLRWNYNICPGFIISTANGKAVSSLYDLEQILRTKQGVLVTGMYPDGTHEIYYID